jgi:serine/threonine protein kinase
MRFDSNTEPIPGYKLLDRLGSGGFGEVWRCEAPGGLFKALKIIHGDLTANSDEETRRAEQELKALKRVQSVRHPYLLSLERYDIVAGKLLIVMELADCNLWDHFHKCRKQGLPGIPREELLQYMTETAEVLDLMNDHHKLQHLDIKPQNLFLIHNHVKVADFGLVKDLEGVRATVTGGVTPVYAAPETFEGIVTKFCDQYSLAIVYVELLTGQRPFAGNNVQQLVMQHLQAAPNLSLVPAVDRPALNKALAKKPDDRHPSCMALVRALKAGAESIAASNNAQASVQRAPSLMPQLNSGPPLSTPRSQMATPSALDSQLRPSLGAGGLRTVQQAGTNSKLYETAATQIRAPNVQDLGAEPLMPRMAPPEMTGTGALVPSLIIGLGQYGLGALQRFRQMLIDRFEGLDRLPHLRLLYIDTDPDTTQSAVDPVTPGALAIEEVFLARLNRPNHYLTPRRGGRSVIEGWFDPQMLYSIPRNPVTMGTRALGRLAFCDHYRTIAKRVRDELTACTAPDAINQAERNTRLGLRTNRPRVYVVTSLCGGTGSGMFIDLAYMIRHRLKYLGYDKPQVFGCFLLPPVEKNPQRAHALSNAYAALTELNHFSLPQNLFSAHFDDSYGQLNDEEGPYNRFWLLPMSGGTAKNTDPTNRVADFLRRELTTIQGRSNDELRDDISGSAGTPSIPCSTFGLSSFSWPRQALVTRASRQLALRLLNNWFMSDPAKMREQARRWVTERWGKLQLSPEPLMGRLERACQEALGQMPDAIFDAEAEPFAPKGWFGGKAPNPQQLFDTIGRLNGIVGEISAVQSEVRRRVVGKVETTLEHTATQLSKEWCEHIIQFGLEMIELPEYRLVGAVSAVNLLTENLQKSIQHYEPTGAKLADQARDVYAKLGGYITNSTKVRLTAAEVTDAIKNYPRWRYQSMVIKHVCQIYDRVVALLKDQLRELEHCRERLSVLVQSLKDAPNPVVPADALLPPGCSSIDHSVQKQLDSITNDDVRKLDDRVQAQVTQRFGSLLDVCLNTTDLMPDLGRLLQEQARAFVSARLGEMNVVEMFIARYGQQDQARQAIRQAFDDAAPDWARPPGPRSGTPGQYCCVVAPPNEVGKPFLALASRVLNDNDVTVGQSQEEIAIYRENAKVNLVDLPHVGPLAVDAYQQATGVSLRSPHTRHDIPRWTDLDEA